MSNCFHVLARLLMGAGLLLAQVPAFGNIIGYWRFEDISGSTAADETGVFNGELSGLWDSLAAGAGDVGSEGWSTSVFAPIVQQTGQANTGSLRMQGGAEFVDLSNGQDMLLGSSFTVEFFMNPDQPVIGSPIFGFAPLSSLYLALSVSGGSLYWSPQFQSQLEFVPADLVQTGVWQHIALVKTPGEYSIYVNGVLDYSGTLPPGTDGPYGFPGSDNTGDRTIGGDSGTFRGYLDEVRISDTALTPDQFLIVPEPGTLGLLGLGGLVLLAIKRGREIRESSQS